MNRRCSPMAMVCSCVATPRRRSEPSDARRWTRRSPGNSRRRPRRRDAPPAAAQAASAPPPRPKPVRATRRSSRKKLLSYWTNFDASNFAPLWKGRCLWTRRVMRTSCHRRRLWHLRMPRVRARAGRAAAPSGRGAVMGAVRPSGLPMKVSCLTRAAARATSCYSMWTVRALLAPEIIRSTVLHQQPSHDLSNCGQVHEENRATSR